jgi:quinol monooxygenase YgiN
MTPLYLIAEIYPHPEKLVEARAIFAALTEKTLQEPGCLLYDLVVEDDSDHWLMLEKWESREAWDAHMQTDHVKQNQIDTPLISSKPTRLRFLTPAGSQVSQ